MVERKKITQKGFKNRQTKVPVENLPGYKRVQPDDYVAQPGHPQYSKGSLPLVTNKGNLGGAVDNSRLAAGAAEKNARATEEKLEAELARLREETARLMTATTASQPNPPLESKTWQRRGQQQQQQTTAAETEPEQIMLRREEQEQNMLQVSPTQTRDYYYDSSHTHTHTHTHLSSHTHKYTHTHIYIYIYIYTHTHTYIYIYIYIYIICVHIPPAFTLCHYSSKPSVSVSHMCAWLPAVTLASGFIRELGGLTRHSSNTTDHMHTQLNLQMQATEEKLEAELARLREETEQQYNQKMEEKRKSTVITENPHRSRPALSLSPSLFVVVSLCVQVSLCL